MRGMFWMASFQFIKFKGKLASSKEAPVIVAGPHTSFYDAIVALVCGPSSVVAKSETAKIPMVGSRLH